MSFDSNVRELVRASKALHDEYEEAVLECPSEVRVDVHLLYDLVEAVKGIGLGKQGTAAGSASGASRGVATNLGGGEVPRAGRSRSTARRSRG